MSGVQPPKEQDVPIFDQEPNPFDVHPVNFFKVIGSQVKRFRSTLPSEYRTKEGFAKLLKPYGTGKGNPGRQMITRIESGDPSVSYGTMVAVFDIMQVLNRLTSQFTSEGEQYDEGDKLMVQNIRDAMDDQILKAKKRKSSSDN